MLRQELSRTDDRERLLGFARRWLYEHQLLIVRERLLRSMIAAARRQHEAQLVQQIDQTVEPSLMMRWRTALTAPHGAGSSLQSWLWSPPAKHSSRQIEEIQEPARSVETACFLRYCLLLATDRLLLSSALIAERTGAAAGERTEGDLFLLQRSRWIASATAIGPADRASRRQVRRQAAQTPAP